MIRNLLLFWHNLFFGWNGKKRLKETNRFLWAICGINWKISDFLFNKHMRMYELCGLYPKVKLSGGEDLIVSLTSYPARISTVWMTIDSLLHQKYKPSKICLYLTKEEFPKGEASLPIRLKKYKDFGLEILFIDENLKPHNKYYHVLKDYPNSLVITVDDDIYYNRNVIENLINLHTVYPNMVCANTVHVIRFDDKNNFLGYNEWFQRAPRQTPSHLNVAAGYNGVLYPPVAYNADLWDSKLIRENSLSADDLWLKANEIVSNIKVVNGDYICPGIEVGDSQKTSLNSSNVKLSKNDVCWGNLCKLFNLDKNKLTK